MNANSGWGKVEGPAMGTAVVLQGGQVEHLASRAFGSLERITTISSYRCASLGTWDNSRLSNVRAYDRLSDLYTYWSLYRLRKMKVEIEAVEEKLKSLGSNGVFPHDEVDFLCEQISQYSTDTTRQMVRPHTRDEAVSKFSWQKVSNAVEIWKDVRKQPDVHERIVHATGRTSSEMPEMKRYLLDWCQTRAQLAVSTDRRYGDTLLVPEDSEDYYFPDELARQGLNECLILWLTEMDLMNE
jgi:hypothetical protein